MLKLENIVKKYDDKTVVDNVSVEVQAGEILAIVGESGSGKTTFLNIISGNIMPDEGKLWLNNEALNLYFNRLIRDFPNIKLVPQDYRLKPEHKIWENIDLALTHYTPEYRKERVKELLELCGITAVKDKKPREVSGGEKQRTAIARAIAEEPLALLLDEPFSNLDSINRTKLRSKIVEIIKKELIACVLVTHDLLDAFLVADKIAIMHQGKILKIDTPQNIYDEQTDEYIKHFVQSAIEPIKVFQERYVL
ncbi:MULTISPECIES: ATP-binding cassette domain-containing protein [Arcicella]|uniref:ATP-binding cassette domain-containing protein n=1 Tax=Arcicella aquatica TaxID=217141 RepID=A0ABU5QUJ6_9BACT|nr:MULTISPECIES: ATP-binding cassette domain-containing protein [Arcicella]MDR6562662.1 iron(III) transport system ATP-binding protein [Arcicella sp. BE51]MDR6812749.1 iron(III) transport system ATP-binding protein [Arcicella sp. BE140]MDR6824061.1 iron(III) transport system ATP-binding protein [Arcicella sp. BE139]MEA5260783.1 ATP-binding cassette domain-containing protein [Arcicella aquatica]